MGSKKLFQEISEALIDMDDDIVEDLCNESLKLSIPAEETITEGLLVGMNRVGELYEEEEYFLPEVMICSDTLNIGLDILKPHIKTDHTDEPIKIVMGVVEGDTHDIGKNLVKIMSEASNIETYDLGKDVPLDKFIETAEEVNADFICMSTLMTTTMSGMERVIKMLEERNLRDKYKVMIGGGPISQKFADSIGADAYTEDANEAVKKIKELVVAV
ncbi:corrinoid protein [Metaclostridioides mangenotii]|jgi:dimethylamine corrinoid protein|uniref:Dimethylamine corrinoid protein n=1 Tax=Metaclostridioides mangenotii TaxID=1540 RepID=A0ABS4EA86_9FIRM|nr:corrinoid protein [Clostridioides mangenotii]MBP1854852.1 dimethylamine corrinoid protein [Clostridioides mangenotii]